MSSFRATLFMAITCTVMTCADIALSCACCADSGHRGELNLPLSEYELDVLSALEPDGSANLVMTSCSLFCASRLRWQSEHANVEFQIFGDQIAVLFNEGSEDFTVLKGTLPEELQYLAVDTGPSDTSEPVWLGTEFLLPIEFYGSGPGWSGGQSAVSSDLIFYGSGNACPDFSMIDHWMLDMKASERHARLQMIGKLRNIP